MRTAVDLRTHVGSVPLPNPVLTASGTAGHGAELASYVDLASLGAIVVKSLCPLPWPGNPAPRVHETPAGMLNSVGLQGPGLASWLALELPALNDRGARVVASIWGRSAEEYAQAAVMLAGAPGVVAVEVNVSCPNLEDRGRMFAHSRARHLAGGRGVACVWTAVVGQVEPERSRHRRHRGCCARRRRRGARAREHGARHGHRRAAPHVPSGIGSGRRGTVGAGHPSRRGTSRPRLSRRVPRCRHRRCRWREPRRRRRRDAARRCRRGRGGHGHVPGPARAGPGVGGPAEMVPCARRRRCPRSRRGCARHAQRTGRRRWCVSATSVGAARCAFGRALRAVAPSFAPPVVPRSAPPGGPEGSPPWATAVPEPPAPSGTGRQRPAPVTRPVPTRPPPSSVPPVPPSGGPRTSGDDGG